MTDISKVVSRFNDQVKNGKEYSMDDLRTILVALYKKPKDTVLVENDNSLPDMKSYQYNQPKTDKTDKKKKKPSAYNNFVGKYIKDNKQQNTKKTARELMSLAAVEWKKLSKEEKLAYSS